MNYYRGEVKIYNSLFTFPDAEVGQIVKNIFHMIRNPSFVMMKMQKQKGNSDCGVFATAVATSLAYGIDPADCVFQQDLIRQHLSQCTMGKFELEVHLGWLLSNDLIHLLIISNNH